MTLKFALAVAAVLLLPAGAAVAQVNTITDKPGIVGTDGKKFKDKDGRICKRLVITGSRMPSSKVCKTQEQWLKQEAEARRELDDQLRRNSTTVCIGGPGNTCIKGG